MGLDGDQAHGVTERSQRAARRLLTNATKMFKSPDVSGVLPYTAPKSCVSATVRRGRGDAEPWTKSTGNSYLSCATTPAPQWPGLRKPCASPEEPCKTEWPAWKR